MRKILLTLILGMFLISFASAYNFKNQTDGNSTSAFGAGDPYGITTNGTDFWFIDNTDMFVYHMDGKGNNVTDGNSTSALGAGDPYGITTNGTDFWITDYTDYFVYHVKINYNSGNLYQYYKLSENQGRIFT